MTLKSSELESENSTVLMNLGSIYKDLGSLDQALNFTLKSLDLNSDNPTALMNLGVIYQDLGNLDQALSMTLKSLEVDPDNPTALMNLGCVHKELGSLDQALRSTIKSIELKPNNPDAYMNLGDIFKEQGDLEQAKNITLKALDLKPDHADALVNLGGILTEQRNFEQARAVTLKAIEYNPDHADAYVKLADICRKEGDIQGIVRYCSKASELQPKNISHKLNAIGQIEEVQMSSESISSQRNDFAKGILEMTGNNELLFNGYPINIGVFWFPYHNDASDKALLSLVADAFATCNAFKSIIDNSPLPTTPKNLNSGNYKVGFYFDNPQESHSVHKLFSGIVQSATRLGLKTSIITSPDCSIREREKISSLATSSLQVSSNISVAIDQIRRLGLDILVFTECTSSWYPYILSMSRLAPVQVGTWGNPVTTGSSAIDYYLSSSLIEPSQAQKHYRERLIKISRLPSKYKKPDISLVKSDRHKFGLDSTDTLIGIPQSLFKFHPDYDDVLESIILQLPNAKYVLIEGNNQSQLDRLKSRWADKAPIALKNSIFLGRLSQADYLCLLETVDLLLDPIYFGSGNTFYESMALGTPLVTMPGDFMRGRIVAGGYKQMELLNPPIAENIRDYIELTLQLARDVKQRSLLKQEIKSAAQKHLFDDNRASDEIINFFKAAVDEYRNTGGLLPLEWSSVMHANP